MIYATGSPAGISVAWLYLEVCWVSAEQYRQLKVLDTSRDRKVQKEAQQTYRLSEATMLIVSSLQDVSSVSKLFQFLFQPRSCQQLLCSVIRASDSSMEATVLNGAGGGEWLVPS